MEALRRSGAYFKLNNMKIEIDLSKVPAWRRAAIIRELQAVADDSLMMTTLEERLADCIIDNRSELSVEVKVAMLMDVIDK